MDEAVSRDGLHKGPVPLYRGKRKSMNKSDLTKRLAGAGDLGAVGKLAGELVAETGHF